MPGGRAELLNGLGSLPRWSSIWLVPAVAAECCAFIALALAQRRILRAGGVNVGASPLARLAVTTQAVGSVLPAGYLFSGVVVLRVLARRVLTNVSLGPKGWGMSFQWMLLYWIGDLACLTITFPATRTALPWRGLLIGYWAVLLTGAICYLSLWRRRSLVAPASGAVARTCRGLGRVHEASPCPKEPGFGSESRTYRSDDQFPVRRRSPARSLRRNDNSPRLLRSRLPAIQATTGRRGGTGGGLKQPAGLFGRYCTRQRPGL